MVVDRGEVRPPEEPRFLSRMENRGLLMILNTLMILNIELWWSGGNREDRLNTGKEYLLVNLALMAPACHENP